MVTGSCVAHSEGHDDTGGGHNTRPIPRPSEEAVGFEPAPRPLDQAGEAQFDVYEHMRKCEYCVTVRGAYSYTLYDAGRMVSGTRRLVYTIDIRAHRSTVLGLPSVASVAGRPVADSPYRGCRVPVGGCCEWMHVRMVGMRGAWGLQGGFLCGWVLYDFTSGLVLDRIQEAVVACG